MARYVVSDLHGMKSLYDAIVDFIKPEDTVFCLGDCGDRGPASWETIKAVMDNPQFTYLMGNHEHMLLAAYRQKTGKSYRGFFQYETSPQSLVKMNGGGDTLKDMWADENKHEYMKRMEKLPYHLEFVNDSGLFICLSHAGYTPPNKPDQYDLVWDRHHFYNPWPAGHDNKVVIHGHTPIPHMVLEFDNMNRFLSEDRFPVPSKEEMLSGALFYSGMHKINIDCASVFTGMTVLLDVDTFDEHIFEVEVPKND